MITLEEFRARCARDRAEDIIDEVLLKDDAVHVSAENRAHVLKGLATAFDIEQSCIGLWVVGSAKLGFSITEKKQDWKLLPRYRPFSAISDIDIAVASPALFRVIWDELSIYAHGHPWMPWNSGRLGDYMVYGWLRPDHFPRGRRVRRCDAWWDQFRQFSADPRFDRHSVRGGLFHSITDLRRYLRRSVLECAHAQQEQA
jgi:hypothetical protein